jgi:hypothetical protein
MAGPSADYFSGHGVVIHFSTHFPVVTTACSVLGPSAARWRYVTCPGCLDVAPIDPRIEALRVSRGLRARTAPLRPALPAEASASSPRPTADLSQA